MLMNTKLTRGGELVLLLEEEVIQQINQQKRIHEYNGEQFFLDGQLTLQHQLLLTQGPRKPT